MTIRHYPAGSPRANSPQIRLAPCSVYGSGGGQNGVATVALYYDDDKGDRRYVLEMSAAEAREMARRLDSLAASAERYAANPAGEAPRN